MGLSSNREASFFGQRTEQWARASTVKKKKRSSGQSGVSLMSQGASSSSAAPADIEVGTVQSPLRQRRAKERVRAPHSADVEMSSVTASHSASIDMQMHQASASSSAAASSSDAQGRPLEWI